MKSRTMTGASRTAAMVAVLLLATTSSSYGAATNTKSEIKCFGALVKAAAKHQKAVVKAMATCRDGLIGGTVAAVPGCPDATASTAIAKSAASIAKNVAAKCHSSCSVSGFDCIDNIFCPPNKSAPEKCTAGAKNRPFHSAAMGFPGAGCETALLPGKMQSPADFATCMGKLAGDNADRALDLVYGSLDETTTISKDAAKCLKGIAKALPKFAGKTAKAVGKCRETQLGADPPLISPDACATDDAVTAAILAKARDKADTSITHACSDSAIAELDLCGRGRGDLTTVSDALGQCLLDVLVEAAYSIENFEDRNFVGASLINAAYPDTTRARCGDGIVNQIPNQFVRLGEECDGDDDDACPGACLPPGDLFECTCSTHKRLQMYGNGLDQDIDTGWSGDSHNGRGAVGGGHIADVSGCDCTQFDAVDKTTCVGVSTDPVCDIHGPMGPRCNWAPYDGISCDQHGDGNLIHTDDDCARCDDNSINAGDYCVTEADCDSQCFDPDGNVTGTCSKQSDCTAPDVCKGRCDNETTYCNVLHNGAQIGLAAQGSAACVDSVFASDVSGTRNIVTGEHAVNWEQRSVTFLAETPSRPCPVCGGFCTAPSSKVGELCNGTCTGPARQCRGGLNQGAPCVDDSTCSGSTCEGLACRFDGDCTGNGTCAATSPECLGKDCQLALLCFGGSRSGRSCRIEAETAFGTTSVDCPALTAKNISGAGMPVSYTPLTSEQVEFDEPGTCDTPGYENLGGCFCVSGGGSTRTQPNRCATACTGAGPDYGRPCAGKFTTCAGGLAAGAPCDEDGDCSASRCTGGGNNGKVCTGPGDCPAGTCEAGDAGATCTDNPTMCDAGIKTGQACTSDEQCPGGACVDACPGGICTPLCVEKGACVGGAKEGRNCGVERDCPGGTCVVTDAEEGVCAGGPAQYHCNGTGWEYRTCLPTAEGTRTGCEAGSDGIVGTDDDFVGAGTCISDERGCFVNNGRAEGGDTLNGRGDPTNTYSVVTYCLTATSSDAVNGTSGLPGPARSREHNRLVPNFTSLP